MVQLHELRRAGQSERNYYSQHLQAFYVLRDALAPFMGITWDEFHDWYNHKLRTAPPEIAAVLRQFAAHLETSAPFA